MRIFTVQPSNLLHCKHAYIVQLVKTLEYTNDLAKHDIRSLDSAVTQF